MQDIGVRVGVQGEQQYRQAIANIVQTSKELNAEMKAMVSGFDATTSAQEQARTKMDLLNKQIQNQTNYIDTLNAKLKTQETTLNGLQQQLDKANQEYGEGSKESQKLTQKITAQETAMSKTRTSISQATTALNGMKSEMTALQPAASGAATSTRELGEAVDDAGDNVSAASSGWSVLRQVVADFATRAATAALSALKDLAKEAISVNDNITKFENTMRFAGFGEGEISKTSAAMKRYADQTVYSLGEVSTVVAQLGAAGVENFEELVEAAGNLNAAAGGTAQSFSTVGLVLTQTTGAGKLTAENWRQLMNVIPGASGKIQDALKEAGAYVGDFSEAMKKGEITADEFNDAIRRVGSEPMAVQAATSATTFEQKLAQLKTKGIDVVSNALKLLSPVIDAAFSAFNALLTPIVKVMDALANGKSKTDQYTQATKALTESVKAAKASYQEINTQYDAAAVLMEKYRGRLQELEAEMIAGKKAGKDISKAQAEYNTIVGLLNDAIPDLNLEINEQTGLLTTNSKEVLANAKAWAEAQKKQAWQSQYTDILLKQAQAEAELATNQAKLKIATDDYNASTKRAAEIQKELDAAWDEYYSGTAKDVPALKKKIDDLTKAWEDENLKVGEAKTAMNKYSEATNTSQQALDDLAPEIEEAKRVFDALMESQADYARKTKVALDKLPPLYAQAARDASAAWNNNVYAKAYNPNKGEWQYISQYKTGLAYVPYDGFIAELHKGERILTAAEALEYRNMRDPEVYIPSAPATPDLSTINNNQRTNVTLNVYGAQGQSEEELAEIVMDRIQRSVNRREALYA